jgi:hypothetical protein
MSINFVPTMSVVADDSVGRASLTEPSCCSRGFAGRIEGWLLHSDLQIDDGTHQGAIAGWLDSGGNPVFVYPEIAGYYLTSMGWLASGAASSREHVQIARVRAQRGAAWIADLLSSYGAPPTRLYLSDGPADWRNDAVFSFDVAMAARGIAATAYRAGRHAHRQTVAALCAWLDRISSDSVIMRSHETVDGATMPDRWSTRPGPHHLKAAAAVLGLSDAGKPLTAMAHRTCTHWAATLISDGWPCQELHALCYGIEGLLMADRTGDNLDQAEYLFARLMELQSSDGTLPETINGGLVRSDVLAQALRIGLLLRGRGHLAGTTWGGRLDALAHALMGFVRVDGGVLFAMNQTVANTWCAMFAHQALYLHAHRRDRDPVPDAAFLYLV